MENLPSDVLRFIASFLECKIYVAVGINLPVGKRLSLTTGLNP